MKIYFFSNSHIQTKHWTLCVCVCVIFEGKQVGSGKMLKCSLGVKYLWSYPGFCTDLFNALYGVNCWRTENHNSPCELVEKEQMFCLCNSRANLCSEQRDENEMWTERSWFKCQSTQPQSPVELPQKRLSQQRTVLTKESCCVKFAAIPCDE